MKSLIIKDTETYTADEIVLLLKENGVIDKNDQHLYILHNNKQIEDKEQSTRKTVNKSIFYAVASTIVSIFFAFYSLWTLIVFIPLTFASYLWVIILSIGSGLAATSGGTICQRKNVLENHLNYKLIDEFKCLFTSSHDYGDTIFFPSESDFSNICKLVVPENETIFRIVKTNMGPTDVCGWKDTIEIYVYLNCIRLKSVFY